MPLNEDTGGIPTAQTLCELIIEELNFSNWLLDNMKWHYIDELEGEGWGNG